VPDIQQAIKARERGLETDERIEKLVIAIGSCRAR
jgi:hypothetical protein